MKKFLFVNFVFLSNALMALPIGNPAISRFIEEGLATGAASWVNFRMGYEGDFVSDERLHQKQVDSGKILEMTKNMQAGCATLCVRNRLDLYGLAGQARYHGRWHVQDSSADSLIEVESRYGFSWAAGTRIIFLEWGQATLSAGGRYQAGHVEIDSLTKNAVPVNVKGARLKQREWQADLGVGYKVKIFAPYIEGYYSKPQYFIGTVEGVSLADDGASKVRMKKQNRFGLALGCGITSGKACFLNLEARLFNEEAATVTFEMRF